MTIAIPETSPPAATPVAGEPLKRFPWKYRAMIRNVRELEPHLTALSDKSLRQYINKIRAAVREADGGVTGGIHSRKRKPSPSTKTSPRSSPA